MNTRITLSAVDYHTAGEPCRITRGGVPAILNVGSLDLLHPGPFRGDEETARLARKPMDAYVAMGCEPTWTCAASRTPSSCLGRW